VEGFRDGFYQPLSLELLLQEMPAEQDKLCELAQRPDVLGKFFISFL